MPNRRAQGREAEDKAASFLMEFGYTIVTRRFSCRGGEIDLVALDGDDLVFVEVKQRLGGQSPEEAVSPTKLARIHTAARAYLAGIGEPERGYRIDMVAISSDGMRLVENLTSW